MASVVYVENAELPDLALTWLDSHGDIIDFSSGYTFSVAVGVVGSAAIFTKSTGIVASASDPNLTLQWATAGELSTLTAGTTYTATVTAIRTSDSKERKMQFTIFIEDSVA